MIIPVLRTVFYEDQWFCEPVKVFFKGLPKKDNMAFQKAIKLVDQNWPGDHLAGLHEVSHNLWLLEVKTDGKRMIIFFTHRETQQVNVLMLLHAFIYSKETDFEFEIRTAQKRNDIAHNTFIGSYLSDE